MLKLYPAGRSEALSHACTFLAKTGCSIQASPTCETTHLLLPVPSFESPDHIKGGGTLSELLADLPKDITVVGGNLSCHELEGYNTLDLLKDPYYVAQNASITAYCAVTIAAQHLHVTYYECPILIIGWGRIGKCLAQLLKNLGADITIAARKAADRGMAKALGYKSIDIKQLPTCGYRVIFNTAPSPILPENNDPALKIELSSKQGIAGDDVILARGLPGRYAPESSGKLIADTIIRLFKEDSK